MVAQVDKKSLLEPEQFIGLSTDTKPLIDNTGVTLRPGCGFLELDTARLYLFDGISTWYPF